MEGWASLAYKFFLETTGTTCKNNIFFLAAQPRAREKAAGRDRTAGTSGTSETSGKAETAGSGWWLVVSV